MLVKAVHHDANNKRHHQHHSGENMMDMKKETHCFPLGYVVVESLPIERGKRGVGLAWQAIVLRQWQG